MSDADMDDRGSTESIRVSADREQCVASGACVAICSQVFALDDDGIVMVIDESPPDALRAAVEEAEEACPSACIEVSED